MRAGAVNSFTIKKNHTGKLSCYKLGNGAFGAPPSVAASRRYKTRHSAVLKSYLPLHSAVFLKKHSTKFTLKQKCTQLLGQKCTQPKTTTSGCFFTWSFTIARTRCW